MSSQVNRREVAAPPWYWWKVPSPRSTTSSIALEVARPAVQVVVREPAAREREPLVEPAELVPDHGRTNRLLLSPIGPNRPRLDEPPGVLI